MIKLPFGVDINNLIDDLRIISWEASEILLYYSQMLEDSNNKSTIIKSGINEDPVTLADLKVNELIIRKINEKYKDINWTILSEENVKVEANYSEIKHDWVWVLDPLDGTKDFIQGTGNYAMHLALTYKKKSFLGVVLIPEKDELWISNGEKLWCEEKDGSLKKFNKSKNNKFLNEMILVTSKNHNNEVLKNVIENKLENFFINELKIRKLNNLPPYSRLISLIISSSSKENSNVTFVFVYFPLLALKFSIV